MDNSKYLLFKDARSFEYKIYGQTFLNKKHKQPNAHEKHKTSFPSENNNRTRHAHMRATSADIIPPHSL